MAAPNAVKLKRELAQVPITAVALYRDPATSHLYVLASEDTDLVIYRVSHDDASHGQDSHTHTPVARVRILSAQPIHGLYVHQPHDRAPSAGRLLLWGGSSVAILRLSDLSLHRNDDITTTTTSATAAPRVARLRAPDWIYDGAVSDADSDLAVLVTAHNEVLTVRFDSDAVTAAVSSPLVSPSRPMLYAANVRWTSATEVLVAAGTVFGDILVWKHVFNGDGAPQQRKPTMLYSLSGHEGSIFGVHMSPLLARADGSPVRLLASCSDDRTIRVWNITESEAGADLREEKDGAITTAGAVPEMSDTGFRCAPVYGEDGSSANGRADVAPVATAMGHASRIWGVKFGLPNASTLTAAEWPLWGAGRGRDGKDLLSVYSFGEDATVQRWSLDLAAALQTPQASSKLLIHDKTYALHDGKHLWSRAVLCDLHNERPTTHILAGGADSKITLVREAADAAADKDRYNCAQTWEISDMLSATETTTMTAPTTKQRGKEIISRYDFVTPDALLAVSSTGRVLLGTFAGPDAAWAELPVDDEATAADMRHVYALTTVSHGGALLGTTTGGVYHFSLRARRITPVTTLAGRVVEMNALSKTYAGAPGDAEAVIHLHRDAVSVYLTLDRDTGALKSQETITGLDSRFVAISAARIDDWLAVGSRHGWISLLRRDAAGVFRPILDQPPSSGDAVTAIVPLPPSASAAPGSLTKYVLTTSRDGKYRIFALDASADTPRLTLLHETAPPFGPWIEGAWFTHDTQPELILYGFRSKDFVVWNETRREELATMDCGGAHRTCRLAFDERAAAGSVRFAFTRTSRLSVHAQRGIRHEPVRLGHHGREIRSLAASGRYVATAAEDTTIRLWEHIIPEGDVDSSSSSSSSSSRMQYMAYMKKHIVGLQKVQWAGDEYLFSSGGNEELFAWRVRTLDSAYAGRMAVMCEGVFMDKSPLQDLRIMDFDVSSEDNSSSSMLVTMAFSNSALKTYRYTAAGGFALVCEGLYTGACLTQARHLDISGGALQVVTASTDGHMALWRGSSSSSVNDAQQQGGQYELRQTLRVHQSSIKSLDVTRLRAGRGQGILTGGDDNALAWTLLKRTGAEGDRMLDATGFRAELGSVVRRAHGAAITGIALLEGEEDGGEEEGIRCVSVSNDQWVKVWRIGRRAEREESMQLLGEAYSGVADAGDVVVLDEGRSTSGSRKRRHNFRRVMVAGVGLEVWRVVG